MTGLRIPAALATIALILAACTGQSPTPSGYITELPPAEDELNIVIWAGYAEDGSTYPEYDWVTDFETETGCQVNATPMGDSAEGVGLIQGGGYDGISASGDATLRLIAAGDVAPVNFDLIPNYAQVFESLKGQAHNTVNGVGYGTPHGRGANLLLYNTDTFAEAPTSWDVVWDADSPAAGQISVYNYAIYIADAALHLMSGDNELGITNPYQLNQEQFDAAVDLLTAQSEIVGEYWVFPTDQIASFGSGDMLAGTTWQYQYNSIILEDPDAPVGITLPDEGSTGWSDTWMITSEAEHPGCMYRWMNWMLDPDTNAEATVYFGEAPVSQEACAAAETWSAGHCDIFHATDEAYFDKIWFWTTPREDCADADDATACVGWDQWVEAWTGVVGG